MQIITSLFYHKIFVTIVLINSAGDSQPFFFSKAKMDKTVATSNKLREANAAFRKTYDKNKKIITL